MMANFNLFRYLKALESASPHRLLFVSEHRQRTVAEVTKRVEALAHGLRAIGLQDGDRVVVLSRTHDQCLEAILAIMAIGAIAVPLNWRWSKKELADAIEKVGAAGIVTNREFSMYSYLCPTAVVLGELHQRSSLPREAYASESLIRAHWSRPFKDTTPATGACAIIFTSGTTGAPKGVLLSHNSFHVQSMAKLLKVQYSAADVYLHTAPLFHVGGLSSAFAVLAVGATQVFMPAFKPAQALSLVSNLSVTAFIAVPAILHDLVSESNGTSFPSVKKLLLGGGELPPALLSQARSIFPSASFVAAYGMTEACSSMTFVTLGDPTPSSNAPCPLARGICVGQPPPGILMGIRVRAPAKLHDECC